MGSVSKILGIFFVGAGFVSVVSLIWPKITNKERPKELQNVYEAVVKTKAGNQVASVLGVSNNSASESTSIAEAAGNIVGSMIWGLRDRVQQSLTQQAATQVSKQFDMLSIEQKKQIEEIICKPKE